MQTIALLPGWGFTAKVWSLIEDQFTGYKIKYIDFPKTDEPQFSQQALEKVMHQLQAQIPEQSIIMAWSLGGTLAIQLAACYPQKCQQLITVSASPKFVTDDQVAWPGIPQDDLAQFKQQMQADLSLLQKKFTANICYPEVNVKIRSTVKRYFLDPETLQDNFFFYLDVLAKLDCRQAYQTLTLPMLHIFGEQDAILPVKAADHIAKLNANTNIAIINNAGHIPFLTHQAELMKIINEFFDEH